MNRSPGQWQAYVEAGATREERMERLAEAPPDLRDKIVDHVETVWKLKKRALNKS